MEFPNKWYGFINNETEHTLFLKMCPVWFPGKTISLPEHIRDYSNISYPIIVTNTNCSSDERLLGVGWDYNEFSKKYAEKCDLIEFKTIAMLSFSVVKKNDESENKIDKMIEELEGKLAEHENKIDKMIQELTAVRDKLKSEMDGLDSTWEAIKNMKIGN